MLDEAKQFQTLDGSLTITVDRVPGDDLQVQWDRPDLLFRPGETTKIRIAPRATGVDSVQSLRLEMKLTPARSQRVLASESWELSSSDTGQIAPIDFDSFVLPDEEGVYDVQFRLRDDSGYLNIETPWSASNSLARRVVQMLVIADQAPDQDTKPFTEIAQVDPKKRDWWNPKWLPKGLSAEQLIPNGIVPDSIPSLLPDRKQPIASRTPRVVDWNRTQVSELGPRDWIAYPLTIKSPGRPHRLVVRYPNDRVMRLGISILEPNAADKVVPLGIDSGVAVDAQPIPNPLELLEHEIVFWPKTSEPMVALVNFDTARPAWFSDVRIQAGPQQLSRQKTNGKESQQSIGPTRLAALYLDKPLIVDTFGATKARDVESGAAIVDWKTFYEAATRLVQYVHWAGYNSAIVTVNCEGSTLYPTKQMSSTPRYDMSVFASGGSRIHQKDVLELMFRLFDRAGLKLIPAVELATPLPSLERERKFFQRHRIAKRNRTLLRRYDAIGAWNGSLLQSLE